MRFDSTLYYHVGEDYSWPLLFDEMHRRWGCWMNLVTPACGWPSITSPGRLVSFRVQSVLFGADVARFSDR